MLIDVLTQLSVDTGLDLVQQRTTLLSLANRAAHEIHKELECNKIFREVTLKVMPNAVVALPNFIGELRGMRMHTNELVFDLQALATPRYTNMTLEHKYKNWREIGEEATCNLMSENGLLTLTCSNVESTPVTVVINGQGANARTIEESVVISSTSVSTIKTFGPVINSISCASDDRTCDITISDSNGTILAVLYNDSKTTNYKIIDVSQVFWTIDTSAGESLIDVAYKIRRKKFSRDTDVFYAGDDFDEAWYNMAMFFHLSPMTDRANDASARRALAMQFIIAAKESNEHGIIRTMKFGRNRYQGMYKRYMFYPGSVTNVDHIGQ